MNRLAHSQSPYLLQHQHNPVDWYPWGEEAFAKARAEDKPLFLSIGYATCHWCHVMAHESFEDAEVAALMNAAFVCVKVDREERPDIDTIYMTVCQIMRGQCGWPLNVLLTPEGEAFFVATYLPKHSGHGRLGMLDFVPRVATLWAERRADLVASAGDVTERLHVLATQGGEAGAGLDADWLEIAFRQLEQRYDPQYGGFGHAPKFPSPHNLLFLLRFAHRTGHAKAEAMATHTLAQMRLGGIFDHLGYGFHRYSTDAHWLLPHFEKMLYDQALLVMAYVEAYQLTQNDTFAETAREVLAYVLRDMTDAAGGFYSAEDADSEGVEGKFYVWSLAELQEVLGREDAAFFASTYQATEAGNFFEEATGHQTGDNILHLQAPLADVAAAQGLSEAALRTRLAALRTRLFAHRKQRIHPEKDDKVLTDWNGLMVAALAKAARALGEPSYAAAAQRAADFILQNLRDERGRLLHRYRHGQAGITAHLDDYAFFIWGLLELYETTLEARFLRAALDLQADQTAHFTDAKVGGFFFTPDDGETLIIRPKEATDNAHPSGNSVALGNLVRLARLTGERTYARQADALLAYVAPQVRQMPSAFTGLLLGVDFLLGPSQEVVVVGQRQAPDTEAMLEALHTVYAPRKVVLFREETDPEVETLAPFVAGYRGRDGKATAYVCEQFACQQPTTQVAEMLAYLNPTGTP